MIVVRDIGPERAQHIAIGQRIGLCPIAKPLRAGARRRLAIARHEAAAAGIEQARLPRGDAEVGPPPGRSEEHTSELQSLMRLSYAVLCLNNKIHPHVQSTDSTANTDNRVIRTQTQ